MKKYLALDLGGTFLKAAIIDEDVNILEKWKVASNVNNKEDLLKVFDEAVLGHLDGVTAICISLPGRMNVKDGIMETAGAFDSFLRGTHIVEILQDRYHLPVGIDNDAKCATNAEIWKGALKDCTNGVVYVIGTGIGGGIEINHQVYRGSHFASGELSCILMNLDDGPVDDNIMARHVATPFLLRDYVNDAHLTEMISGEDFFEKVNSGDEIAIATLRKFCKYSAMYFYNIQVCLDVERIAIGGGISEQPILLEMLNEELDKVYQLSGPSIRPELVRCKYGNDANLIGAVKSYIDLH